MAGTSVSVTFPAGSELSEELIEQLKDDLANSPVRQLTSDERKIYSLAVISAVNMVPAFREAVAVLRPYMNATASTAYTDRFARVGLSYWFFHCLNKHQQASVLLHETMHVLNSHFVRGEAYGAHPQTWNIAGDFEINTTLSHVPTVDLKFGILPNKDPYSYPPNKTMELYLSLMKEDGTDQKNKDAAKQQGDSGSDGDQGGEPGQGGDGSQAGSGSGQPGQGGGSGGDQSDEQGGGKGSGSGSSSGEDEGDKEWGCGASDEKTEEAADEAGISKASEMDQSLARKHTASRIVDEKVRNKQRGDGSGDAFLDAMLKLMAPAKVDWRKTFAKVVASSVDSISRGRSDYNYKRVSRRMSGQKYIFPGMVTYNPKVMLGIDTSGSMDQSDYRKALTEIESILKTVARGKDAVSIFSVDTQISNIQPVSSVKGIKLRGGGGTQMAVGFRYVSGLKKRPDIFVLSTDGYIDWEDVEKEARSAQRVYKSIILVTTPDGFKSAPSSIRSVATVIDISSDD